MTSFRMSLRPKDFFACSSVCKYYKSFPDLSLCCCFMLHVQMLVYIMYILHFNEDAMTEIVIDV